MRLWSLIPCVLLLSHFLQAQTNTSEYVNEAEYYRFLHSEEQSPRLDRPSFSVSCFQWTTPVIIDTSSPDLLSQQFPALAIDDSDHIAVAWTDRRRSDGFGQIVVETSSNSGQTWTRSVAYGYGYNRGVRDLVFDHAGNLWLVWIESSGEFQPFFLNLSKSVDNGQTFTTFFTSLSYAAPFFRPKIAIDEWNNVFLLWDDQQFKLTRFAGGNISQRIDTDIPNDTLRIDFWCSLSVGAGAKVYAVWTGVRNLGPGQDICKVYCSASTDTGSSFVVTSRVDTTELINSYSTQRYPASTVDSNGSVYVSYMRLVGIVDSSSMMVAASSDYGNYFRPPVQLVELGSNSISIMTVDATNGECVLWAGENGATFSRSTDGGHSFSLPQLIGSEGTADIGADYSGNLFALFETLLKVKFSRTNVFVAVGESKQLPSAPEVLQNYPNPFNPSTTFDFTIPFSANVTLTIYDVLGRKTEQIVSTQLARGRHTVLWIPKNLASGVYFFTLEAEHSGGKVFSAIRKLIYLR